MRLTGFVAPLLLAVAASRATAQKFFTPGQEIDGKISVQVNATLNDGIGGFYPVPNLSLTLYRGATDSLQLQTDEAGVLQFAIAPGTYRLASAAPLQYHGRSYRWNVPLVVQRRMEIVNLTTENASVGAAMTRMAERPDPPRRVEGERVPREAAVMDPGFSRKDGATGVLFSFLLTGGGQFYSGKNTKGALLLGTAVLSVAGAIATSCTTTYCSGDTSTGPAMFLITGLGIWVYSMASAPADAREYNERHSNYAGPRPVIDRRDGRTGLGLAMAF